MAIVKMKHLRLVAMQEDREEILHLLQRMGCVEIDEPRVDWSDPVWAELGRPSGESLSAARERKSASEQALTILKRYAPEKGGMFRERPVLTEAQLFEPQVCQQAAQAVQSINHTQQRIATLQAQKTKLEGQKAVLAPWLSLDVPLDTESTKEVFIGFGTVPASVDLMALKGALLAESDLVELTAAGSDREYHYLLLVYHASAEEAVTEIMRENGWSKANLRDWTGTAAENDRRIDQELAQTAAELKQAEQELAAQGGQMENIYQEIDRSAVDIKREDARSHLLDTQKTFFLEGWIPAEYWEKAEKNLEKFDCAYQVEDPAPEEYPEVPVQLKNNWFTRPLNMVTEMYSLPAYGSLDPNPLMAPFFIFFYGFMMADMGYGLLMILASLFVMKKVKPNGPTMRYMFPLLGLGGVSTFIMGALTGGFFGDLLPQMAMLINPNTTFTALPALFSPLDDALPVLIGSLVIGLVQIFTGMAVSMYRKIKAGDVMDALCNEGAWYLVFILFGVGFVIGQLKLALVAIVVLLVLTQGYGKKGIVGKLMGIGGSLYNNITGYFSDILSYSRLMALMLAGAVIAQVFNTLGALTGNVITFFIISMVGNALNFALNLLGCYVHDMRLQCLEYFGRFYEDGGKAFQPMAYDTKYVDIVKE